MSSSERRFRRFILPPEAFAKQQARSMGLLGKMIGWRDCTVSDMSIAGALLISKREFSLGENIEIKLEMKGGKRFNFAGSIVNLGMHKSSLFKYGVRLVECAEGGGESKFLNSLGEQFKACL